MRADARPGRSLRPWLWAAASTVVGGASLVVAFVIAVYAGQLGLGRSDGDLGTRLDLALFLLLISLFGSLAALASARLVFGRWPAVPPVAILVAGVGVALAIAVELALHEWARVRFGSYYDPDMVGWTAGLAYALALSAAVSFAVLIAPHGAAEPPLLGAIGLAVPIWLAVGLNVPGLLDGIELESWPLAILVGLSGVYALAAVLIGARRVGPQWTHRSRPAG